MNKRNVFVFPCGSEIGLELYKSLSQSTHFKLIGGSSVDDHGRFVYTNYIGDLPFVDDPHVLDKLNAIIDREHIDFIFPAHDSVVLLLAQAKAAGKLHCEVVTSPLETCEIARSKLKTYQCFEGIIPTPHVFKNITEVKESDLPIFLKPDVGQGSKGTSTARSLEDIRFYTQKDASLLLLEHLPDNEYTVDCFTDKDGKLRFCEGRQRVRIANGISVNSARTLDKRFQDLAEKINARLTFRGVWFFQVKESTAKEFVLMEIAPRVAGTMGLARCKGVNLPLLSLFDAMGYDVDVFENGYGLVIDRALQNRYKHNAVYKHVYLDFDDLVVFDGKVNPMVMAFVHQCLNKGIKVHLTTKHKYDIHKTLERYRLTSVFDEVIPLSADEEKSPHIKHKDAIFIDDSFAERKQVHDALGIPTFDAHMIEALMESF